MKNILIIPSIMLPMPPVKGGAVQQLIKFFLDWNEKQKKYRITVFSIYDSEAAKKTSDYEYCIFKYVKIPNSIINYRDSSNLRIASLSRRYMNRVFQNYLVNHLKSRFQPYDAIISENTLEFRDLLNQYTSNLILHLHNDYLNIDTERCKEILTSYCNIFTVSKYIANRVGDINSLYNCNVPIDVLYNGVEIERFFLDLTSERKKEVRNKYGFSSTDVVLLFSGRLVAEKGIKELIQAFLLLPNNLNAKLLVVGSKVYGRSVKDNFLNELEIIAKKREKDIVFTGYVDYGDLPEIYSSSDIGVLPTLWEEPLSLSVIEYMAAKLPVVISNSGGMVELVNEGCGIVIDKNDDFIETLSEELKNLIINIDKRQSMSVKALERAQDFSKEKYCKKFDNLLNDILTIR